MKSSPKTLLLMLLVTLTIFGGALVYFTMEYLSSVTGSNFPAVGMGAYVMYVGSRIRVTGQWPPAGMGFQSKAPVMLGARTNLVAFSTMGLGGVLLMTGLFLPLLGWRLMNMLGE
jgi:hypothetical protein